MKFNDYQKKAISTDITGLGKRIKLAHEPAYVDKILSLVGESGEVAEKYKKIIRDKKGIISDDDRQELIKELGDVLWYIAVLAHYLDIDLEDLAQRNVDKLASRQQRKKIGGKGDNR